MLFVRECLACGVHISDTDKVKTTRETSNFTVHNYEEGRKRLILTRNPFQQISDNTETRTNSSKIYLIIDATTCCCCCVLFLCPNKFE